MAQLLDVPQEERVVFCKLLGLGARIESDMTRGILAGQRAFATGATSGIGRAISVAMGAGGAAVAMNYRAGAEAAERVVAEIKDAG